MSVDIIGSVVDEELDYAKTISFPTFSMNYQHLKMRFSLFVFLDLVFLLWSGSSAVRALGNDTDRLSLLAFKEGITQDPNRVMSTWNDSTHFCEWVGVTCGLPNQRVETLNLGNKELVGVISSSLGNLSFLTAINLSSNSFSGKIPDELGRLSKLEILMLRSNSLGGEIPVNLSKCLKLSVLDLTYNELKGNIPFQFSDLKNLTNLYISVNNLTGTIPPWIGKYSSLRALSLARNTLQGNIPNELNQLSQLQIFQLAGNMLSGLTHPSLYNMTSIVYFSVAGNQLHGNLPPDVGLTFPNLQSLFLGDNNFQGGIPESLSNASGLQQLDFYNNGFSGPVPLNLGRLQGLVRLNFGHNQLGYGRADDLKVITSLTNCTILKVLSLAANHLGGELPGSVGNLSTHLKMLTLGKNRIRGTLPASIENLVNLTDLSLGDNLLSGPIPFGIGMLRQLQVLYLDSNKFSGQIPASLGNLTRLVYLYIEQNRLEGSIPPSLGNCNQLILLDISLNNLSGIIPTQLFALSSLLYFAVSNNSLSGSLPLEVGSLINLETLDTSENHFSGELPVTLGSCLKLEQLLMRGNSFQGPIPQSLKSLRGAQIIDFSHNNLSGTVPDFLISTSSLEYLDLSYNDLDGEVPEEGIFANATAVSVRGNKNLCGGIKELHLPNCTEQTSRKNLLSQGKIILITLGSVLLVMFSISLIGYWFKTSRKRNDVCTATTSSEKWTRVSYLDIFNSTNGFSSECLIGEGSFGSVYRGMLGDQNTVVAIKVMKLQQEGASKSFIAECNALKNIRHRNLIQVLNVCSSADFNGNDFKALIFEFMPNGSLDQWLHPSGDNQQQSRNLSFIERLNIAIDVAFGLEYLHHSCEESLVHCDIKPSNVLLDMDMIAHIGDFGLARFLFDTDDNQILSSRLKGSIGYIPPEYAMGGHVSKLGDMYSYGILLLEIFTGRRPTDDMFKDGLSLYDFVTMSLPDRALDIVDASLLSDVQEDEKIELGNAHRSDEAMIRRRSLEWEKGESLISVIMIALQCCAPLPKDRVVARDAIKKLIFVKEHCAP